MLIKQIVEEIQLYLNQSQSQYFPPEDIVTALNRAQLDTYAKYYKIFEATQKVSDALRNLKSTVQLFRNSENGQYGLPANYFNAISISSMVTVPDTSDPVQYEEWGGKIFTDGEWVLAKESDLLPPNEENPKSRIIGQFIEVVPAAVISIRLYYLKSMPAAVYAYDVVNEQIVYKDQGSVDVSFPLTEYTDLIAITCKYLGFSMKDQMDIQAEQIMTK